MNRSCYRLVFNPHRGMLMAVEESAASRGKGPNGGRKATTGNARTDTVRFALPTLVLAAWIAVGLPVNGWAQVVADPNAGAHRPTIGQTANRLSQVDITRPSRAGVSTNAYTRFDVPHAGVILNNSPTAIATQQAGYINGNPNLLPGGSARIIVNQVTSALPSQLKGYLEVAGPRAEVIVANPNGIFVDGAGFINTSRATLTTGTPMYGGSGSLDAFRVNGGQITIQGKGLNAANVDQIDLIAREVKANAALYANRLNVIAGANEVNHDTLAATPIASASPAPAFGIDVAQLGGMYANKIMLASTERGVGVSLAGVMAAQMGDMTLRSDGKLVMSGQSSASGNLGISARGGISHRGTTYARGAVDLRTDDTLKHSGMLAAQQSLGIKAGDIASTGTLAAGIDADGATGKAADLTIKASGALAATGRNIASGNATLHGAGVNLAGSQTTARGNLDISAKTGDLDLRGASTTAGAALTVSAAGALDNRGGTLYGQRVTIDQVGATLDNSGGRILGGQDIDIKVASMWNLGGDVEANRDVTVSGAVSGSGSMIAGRNLRLTVDGDYTNDAKNRLGANGDMRISASGTLSNTGALAAKGALTVAGKHVVNAAVGKINASSTSVTADTSVSNAGRIEGTTVKVNAPTIDNTGTVIGEDVTVQGTDITNDGTSALMAAVRDLKLYATSSVRNLDGATLYSAGNLQIARDGTRDATTGLLTEQTNVLINRSAAIEAEGDIDIAAKDVRNTRTRIVTEAGTPVQTAVQTLKLWQAGLSGRALNYHASITFPGWKWGTENASISADQANALRAPITVTVNKSTVTKLDTDKKTLSFTDSPIEEFFSVGFGTNCDAETGICSRPIATRATQYYEAILDNGDTYSITFWPDWDPNIHIRPDDVRLANFGTDHTEVSRATITTTATDRLISATEAAKIQAGGNIRINSEGGSIFNQSSTMAGGANLVRVAGKVEDVGTVLQQRVTTQDTSTFVWHRRTGPGTKQQVVAYPSAPQAPTTVAALAAIATANQAVKTSARKVSVKSVDTVGATLTGSGMSRGGKGGTGLTADTLPGQPLAGGIPNLTLPTNGLYTIRSAPGDTYLVATDPRFTQYSRFLSSDYMLGALGIDPQMTQKRLGDGFYEQKLVRDQITQLTGRTFLAGHTSQVDEYQALMSQGVAVASAFGLMPGIGLTAEQMRQLTTDIVWMVSQDVTLPDGSTQSVLVPKVYLAHGNGIDLNSTGALVAGKSVEIQATDNVANSGAIVGDKSTKVIGNNIVNRGRIGGTGTTVVAAQEDVRNLGGRITGTDTLVSAGRDVINAAQTITNTTTLANGNSASATGVGAIGTISATNNVAVLAGRDIGMAGGNVSAGNDALLGAGRDLDLGTAATGTTQDATAHGGRDYLREQTTRGVGSRVQAGGSVTAVAGRDATLTGSAIQAGSDAMLLAGRSATVTASLDTQTRDAGSSSNKRSQFTQSSYDEAARGSSVQAGNNATLGAGQAAAAAILEANGIAAVPAEASGTGNLAVLASSVTTGTATAKGGAVALVATGDVTIGTVAEQHTSDGWSQSKTSGFLSKKETTTITRSRDTVAVGSVISGDTVLGSAGRDLAVSGSTVAGTQDVGLEAGRNLTIGAAENTSESHSYSRTTARGFGATGGGLSYGSRDQKDTINDNAVTQTGSLVGSTDGNVSLKAGSTLRVTGSQLIAAKDLTGVGADVAIEAAKGRAHHDETHEIKQTGLTLGVSGGALGSAINAGQKVSSATKSQDGRASALWGIAAGRDAYDAAKGAGDAMKSLAGGSGPLGTAVTLSLGSSKSKNTLTQDNTSHTGSKVQAGGKAVFIATGQDANGNKTAGNLDIVGSSIAATRVGLAGQGKVNIVSATDTYETHTTNKSSSGSIGMSYSAQGFGVSASGSTNKGNSDTSGATQLNSRITGSESVSIVSGGDTNILGGVVSGRKVSADIGGHLNLASYQDTEQSRARQTSAGGGLSFSQGGGLSGSLSASTGKANGNFANVAEQSGIYAGDGGFDLNVKGNTDLQGALIASTATKDKNSLKTGTLSWDDIENRSDYKGTSFGVAGGFTFGPKVKDEKTGQTSGKNTGGVSPMIPQHKSGRQRGTAQSGIAEGTIHITDDANQKQDVATLNRDTTDTNSTVRKGPDLNNLLNKQADTMAAAQAAGEAVAKSVGDIASSKLKDAAIAQSKAEKAFDADPSEDNRANLAKATADVEGWKDGGEYRAALHAAGGAMIAGLGGANVIAGAVGAGASSLAAGKLAELGSAVSGSVGSGNANLDEAIGNLAANIVAGGIGAAVGGGAGAATGANVDRFNRQLHPEDKATARRIAEKAAADGITKPDGSPISVAQIEETMRSGSYRGESAGTIIAKDDPNAIYDSGAKFSQIGDGPMMMQVTSKPKPHVASLIQSMTGGDDSPYTWVGIPSGKSSGPIYSTTNPYVGGTCASAECAAGLGQQGRGLLPDYISGSTSALSGVVGTSVNLHDGTAYLHGGVTQANPRSISFKPGQSITVGYIFGANNAKAVSSFLTGSGTQAFLSVPTPWNVNAVVSVTHAYGGRSALEFGVSPRSKISFGASPWSHSAPLNKPQNAQEK
ncbi:hemagglutinin repeat-containing protein [Cupriavidus sp. SW-Y-13]|uniref:two-partner secretion domain-containing protein n=2 Tax=unclassified Cupriavidus TaxID=2640874 RepID=UPI00210836F0|nr:hemagglutinin repeat-containing protein [Cupriavidus sp. SW-Y-13]